MYSIINNYCINTMWGSEPKGGAYAPYPCWFLVQKIQFFVIYLGYVKCNLLYTGSWFCTAILAAT